MDSHAGMRQNSMMPQSELVEPMDEALARLHARSKRERFFGVVELHYQDGQIARVKRQEVYLPKDLLRLAK
jgi:hypothetical protein